MVLKTQYSKVSTRPVKRFFVDMLIRDIALEDAILDLLDNCIDGVQRSMPDAKRSSDTPYKSYYAKITIDKDAFTIADNCGGIPWSEHDRAFRMGQPPFAKKPGMPEALLVGAYGIGMKRAIFKLGTEATISTRSGSDSYQVIIPPGWTEDQENWDLEATASLKPRAEAGTTISVVKLSDATKGRFASGDFLDNLIEKIEQHYAFIISKGFEVHINKHVAVPKKIAVKFSESPNKTDIRPYIFRSRLADDLEVFVAVGLREPIPDAEATLDAQEEPKLSTDYAGWTIICNDRVVLYCNRDELTGWGTANIPRYHTQFIAISGIVEFKGAPSKLPTTTTKRGLEFSSVLYQQVLNRMRDGTRMFVDYTNWWKQNEPQARKTIQPLSSKSLNEIKRASNSLAFNATKTGLKGEIYKPVLPRPQEEQTDLRIAFYRPRRKVLKLAEMYFEDADEYQEKEIARQLGERLFDDAFAAVGGKKK